MHSLCTFLEPALHKHLWQGNRNYLTISACAELVEEKCIESVFSTQDLVILTNIDEALQYPT